MKQWNNEHFWFEQKRPRAYTSRSPFQFREYFNTHALITPSYDHMVRVNSKVVTEASSSTANFQAFKSDTKQTICNNRKIDTSKNTESGQSHLKMAKWYKHETSIYQPSVSAPFARPHCFSGYDFVRHVSMYGEMKMLTTKTHKSLFKIDNLPNFTINCDFIFKCLLLEKLDLKYVVLMLLQWFLLVHISSIEWVFVCFCVFEAKKNKFHRNVYTQYRRTQHLKSKLCLFKILIEIRKWCLGIDATRFDCCTLVCMHKYF